MKRKLILCLAAIITFASVASGASVPGGNTVLAQSLGQSSSPLAFATSSSSSISTLVTKLQETTGPYYNNAGYSSNHYAYTDADVKMLAIVIYLEVRGETYTAKLAVGDVIMNRVLAPGYPGSTIKDVVTRPNQFAYKASVTPTAECMQAARDVLAHEVWVIPQNTYFFRATSSKSNWGRHKYYKLIGNTTFYTDSYAGRYNGTTIPDSLFQRVYKWPQYGCKPAARVKKVQRMLKGLGYTVSTDGYFGQETKDAMIKFQQKNGLTADGVAGPGTLKKLISKYGLSKYLKL